MIEFLNEPHLYIWDGEIVPSVTQFIREINGQGDYKDVPLSVLSAKAQYGTKLHEWCETYLLYGEDNPLEDENMRASADQFKELSEKWTYLSSETVVGYRHAVAGKYDLLVDIDGYFTLIDIKTTYKLDKEYLSWQLSLYSLAIEETYGTTIDQVGCIWLPKKRKGKFVNIERKCTAEVDKAIDDYVKKHNADED